MNKKIKSIILILSLSFVTSNIVASVEANAEENTSTSTPAVDTIDNNLLETTGTNYNDIKSYNDFQYVIKNDNTIEIYKYTGDDSNVIIPKEIDSKLVTSIGGPAFNNKVNLKSVYIPDTVTYISEYAFTHCKNLESVEISKNVTYLHRNAFLGCSSLKSISIAQDNPKYISIDGVVYNKEQTEIIIVPGAIDEINIPNTVKRIVPDCFYGCSRLTNVVIPNSVTCIDMRAFNYCTNLKSVIVPSSVTAIGEGAFDSCNDSFIIYGEANSYIQQYVSEYNVAISKLDLNVYGLFKLNFVALPATSTPVTTATVNNLGQDTNNSNQSKSYSLPKTATKFGNLAVSGVGFMIVAGTVFYISKKRV